MEKSRLFVYFGFWFLIITFVGFSHSFYLRNETEPLSLHLMVHGVFFTAWIVLFLVQGLLINSKKYQLHKTLGLIGLILILVMIPAGFYPVLYKVSIGTKTVDHAGHNLFGLLTGFIFFFLGFFNRKNALKHKRYMVFATLMFTAAAIDRIAFVLYLENNLLFRKGMTLLPAIILFFMDLRKRKELIWLDLSPIIVLMGIYYLADYFWLSRVGKGIMDILVGFI